MEAFKKDAQQAFEAYALQSSNRERELQRRFFNLKLEADMKRPSGPWLTLQQFTVTANEALAEVAILRDEMKAAENKATCAEQLCENWEAAPNSYYEKYNETKAALARTSKAQVRAHARVPRRRWIPMCPWPAR